MGQASSIARFKRNQPDGLVFFPIGDHSGVALTEADRFVSSYKYYVEFSMAFYLVDQLAMSLIVLGFDVSLFRGHSVSHTFALDPRFTYVLIQWTNLSSLHMESVLSAGKEKFSVCNLSSPQ